MLFEEQTPGTFVHERVRRDGGGERERLKITRTIAAGFKNKMKQFKFGKEINVVNG